MKEKSELVVLTVMNNAYALSQLFLKTLESQAQRSMLTNKKPKHTIMFHVNIKNNKKDKAVFSLFVDCFTDQQQPQGECGWGKRYNTDMDPKFNEILKFSVEYAYLILVEEFIRIKQY